MSRCAETKYSMTCWVRPTNVLSRSTALQESAAGDVHQLLGTQGGYLPEHTAQQQIMRPLASAVAYLHAQACRQRPTYNPSVSHRIKAGTKRDLHI